MSVNTELEELRNKMIVASRYKIYIKIEDKENPNPPDNPIQYNVSSLLHNRGLLIDEFNKSNSRFDMKNILDLFEQYNTELKKVLGL